ncbi:MAG: peptide-methionine (S)-S-oxide reductase MsrA [Marinobacter sp.]|nr:peptide-methionine (S)-S-oxide reductase MsrA [Marinobacter sp.]
MVDSCNTPGLSVPRSRFPLPATPFDETEGAGVVVLAGGCFWCVEAVFLAIDGVKGVVSGYAGGTPETANYDAVCSGTTGHAEVVRIEYDSKVVSLGELLQVFFSVAHDPTQLDRQGNDRGRQYRSAVFYASEGQRRYAADYIAQLQQAGVYDQPVVTTLEPLDAFYPAEEYHQNYAARHPFQPYIMAVAAPKVRKLEQTYADYLAGGDETSTA